eukprot:CAMPEP_0184690198 /NCGR_PEP_ID=MMETSP0312-20130426/31090_1 /TAXON_ID=31354 /ORGANISM="Compsopogon coeruleus, Strain SAG 36.94" /LENGTH=67 /DNA_ID=CAMNT_0027147653 /DNA_START=937 /DNA_END=1140 /DNA_ORIENTATION=-
MLEIFVIAMVIYAWLSRRGRRMVAQWLRSLSDYLLNTLETNSTDEETLLLVEQGKSDDVTDTAAVMA